MCKMNIICKSIARLLCCLSKPRRRIKLTKNNIDKYIDVDSHQAKTGAKHEATLWR